MGGPRRSVPILPLGQPYTIGLMCAGKPAIAKSCPHNCMLASCACAQMGMHDVHCAYMAVHVASARRRDGAPAPPIAPERPSRAASRPPRSPPWPRASSRARASGWVRHRTVPLSPAPPPDCTASPPIPPPPPTPPPTPQRLAPPLPLSTAAVPQVLNLLHRCSGCATVTAALGKV